MFTNLYKSDWVLGQEVGCMDEGHRCGRMQLFRGKQFAWGREFTKGKYLSIKVKLKKCPGIRGGDRLGKGYDQTLRQNYECPDKAPG